MRNHRKTYLAVFRSISITKSILGDCTFARANARTIEHLSLMSFGGSLGVRLTRIYSPRGPIRVIVSATDYLFN